MILHFTKYQTIFRFIAYFAILSALTFYGYYNLKKPYLGKHDVVQATGRNI